MTPQPGDVGFAHTHGTMGKLIRIGQALKGKRGSEFNHAFIIDRVVGGECYVIQATLRGVTDTAKLSEVAPGGRCVTFAPPLGTSRKQIVTFARAQVGIEYGMWTIIAISLDILSWQWFPAFRGARKSSWICSALVAESLRFGGWLYNWIDVYTATPAQLYCALNEVP